MIGDWTTAGKRVLGNLMIGTADYSKAKYIALGDDDTPAKSSDTGLGNEIVRQAISTLEYADDKILLQETFLAADCAFYIKEAGIFADEPGNPAGPGADSGALIYREIKDVDNSPGVKDQVVDAELALEDLRPV